ncbi:hypothetical protein [Paraburkholderia caledonica]|jgi:ABC-type ATPase with predicted acetyltransferase domain|uniref:hypothetical protein n=1 Tax=Paraburkholderia caledonica TaxID=134536 RepID=UPI0005A7192E|nr:hypothetical protein [Paraburkholderia caledonica]
MAKHQPYDVVLSYTNDPKQLVVHTVEVAKLAPLLAERMELPVWDEGDSTIDDEFARRLGVAMLNLIALGQPGIKQYMRVTQDPTGSLPSPPGNNS